jgi:hypothetical protein
VGDSVTGDKKAQAFEDSFLDELIAYIKQLGFLAVTYMPTRNTLPQLQRLMRLCEAHDLFQISGEDINTPFQSFVCEKLALPEFSQLIDASWALIGHERMAHIDPSTGMFAERTATLNPSLADRVVMYASIGRDLMPRDKDITNKKG